MANVWRWARLFLIAAILGNAMTCAVAWGCLLWAPSNNAPPMRVLDPGHAMVERLALRRPQHRMGKFDRAVLFENSGTGWQVRRVLAGYAQIHHASDLNQNSLTHVAAGWPRLALSAERVTVHGQSEQRDAIALTSVPGADPGRSSLVPIRPVWSAFAANTLLYASLAFVLMLSWRYARRAHRIRKRRCPECAYSLNALPAARNGVRCPECGTSAKWTKRT